MLENRTIVVITIGYILGIIMGLYCKISIVFLYLFLAIFLVIKKPHTKKFKLLSFRRYSKYIKIIFTKKVINIILVVSIFSNSITLYENNRYDNLYKNVTNVVATATVVSNQKERDYKNTYKIKIENFNGQRKYKNTYLYLNVNKKIKKLEYGDRIKIIGDFISPSIARNYRGFDYKEYLKTQKVYGTINSNEITKLKSKNNNLIMIFSNNIFLKLKKIIQNNFENDKANIILGLVLGYTEEIDDKLKTDFSESNLSHILAVSGMHVNFLILFMKIILEKIVGKRLNKILTCFILIGYLFITGFSPSVVRACIMAQLMLFSKIFYKRNDVWQNLSLALLIILIYNPFLIKSVSVILSFVGTLGILSKPKKLKSLIYVIISVTIWLLPFTAIYFNKISVFSLIISAVAGIMVAPIMFLSLIFIIFHIFLKSNIFIKNIISFFVELLIKIARFGSNMPLNKVYVITPNLFSIAIYYFCLIAVLFLYNIYKSKKRSSFNLRIRNLCSLVKYKFNENKKKIYCIIFAFSIICIIVKVLPGNLKIYFIDVGQGDSCLIITPYKKSILIDGGGSESYNVGKNTLLPYLLDRGIKKIDYAIISHFDTDHVRADF